MFAQVIVDIANSGVDRLFTYRRRITLSSANGCSYPLAAETNP